MGYYVIISHINNLKESRNNMSLKKYLNKADKLELATYKLALTCQINDTQATIDLIDKQITKIELREPSDIKGGLAWNKYSKLI